MRVRERDANRQLRKTTTGHAKPSIPVRPSYVSFRRKVYRAKPAEPATSARLNGRRIVSKPWKNCRDRSANALCPACRVPAMTTSRSATRWDMRLLEDVASRCGTVADWSGLASGKSAGIAEKELRCLRGLSLPMRSSWQLLFAGVTFPFQFVLRLPAERKRGLQLARDKSQINSENSDDQKRPLRDSGVRLAVGITRRDLGS